MALIKAEYIWLDGTRPTPMLRSKTKIIEGPARAAADIPVWAFDGSSTEQATGSKSDCLLAPVRVVKDPIREGEHALVMCEVMNADGTPHETNTRSPLRAVAKKYEDQDPWFGIEQEYTLFQAGRPLGFPEEGFPAPQGPYYCGVGAGRIFGRALAEAHLDACMRAGLTVAGINAEVMPGQWEFQIGPVGPLAAGDELWLARWILERLGEERDIVVSYAPKPVHGDWNGAGAHTNFSTRAMRGEDGIRAIEEACIKLGLKHADHIAVYGAGNAERLTGKHETCSIREFRFGVSDRGASIRIPIFSAQQGRGYLEDRRPAANMDPYRVAAKLIETVAAPLAAVAGFDGNSLPASGEPEHRRDMLFLDVP
ncbi:MAG: glutamine synthetase GlnII [Patescibacteria group bacterium]